MNKKPRIKKHKNGGYWVITPNFAGLSPDKEKLTKLLKRLST